MSAKPQPHCSVAAIAFGLVGAAARHGREILDFMPVDQRSEQPADRQGRLVMNAPAS